MKFGNWKITKAFAPGRYRVQWFNGKGLWWEEYGPWYKVPLMVWSLWKVAR